MADPQKNRESSKRKRFRKRAEPFLILLLAALLLFSVTPPGRQLWGRLFRVSGFAPETEAPLSIHFLDVGKADAVVIVCEGHAALIDAGTYADGETVSDYLMRGGFPPLEYAFVSHPDSDHMGGMAQVLSERGAGALLRSSCRPEAYDDLRLVLQERGIPERVVFPGDSLSLGGAVLDVLWPGKDYDDTNNASLVIRLSYRGFTALFCGDIESRGELDLIKSGADLNVDLLKAAHHGSKTSSTDRFLRAVQPKYAVVSTGVDRNRLPNEETMVRLEGTGAEIYQTDVDGTVVFAWDGEQLTVQTNVQ